MLNFSPALPEHRLGASLIKRGVSHGQRRLNTSLTIYQGSKLSLFFRPMFEHKRIKAIVGGNLALITLFSSILSSSVSAISPTEEIPSISSKIIELTTQTGLRLPIANNRISQGFSSFHPGLDLAAPRGEPIFPITKGKVDSVVYDQLHLGNHIVINHGSGFKSLYAHLSKIEVSSGEKVESSKIIGRVGATGRATGNHLHLEIYEDDKPINPRLILPFK